MRYFFDDGFMMPAIGTTFSIAQFSYFTFLTLCLYQFGKCVLTKFLSLNNCFIAIGKTDENKRREVERLLENGKLLLSKGQLQEALQVFLKI
jgi:hypothetical protein